MLAFLITFLPIISFILWVYYKDKYNRENISILLKYFILGIILSFFAIIIEKFLIDRNIFEDDTNLIYTAFVIAGCTEEILKGLVLYIFSKKEDSYDEKLDGIMYSVFLSLGFATVENLIHINYDSKMIFQVAFIRAIISMPAHIMFAITMGYYISKYKFEKNIAKKRQNLILAFLIPILLHGTFDFILMIQYRWSIIVFIVYIVYLWKSSLDKLDEYTNNSRKKFLKRYKFIRHKKRKDD